MFFGIVYVVVEIGNESEFVWELGNVYLSYVGGSFVIIMGNYNRSFFFIMFFKLLIIML